MRATLAAARRHIKQCVSSSLTSSLPPCLSTSPLALSHPTSRIPSVTNIMAANGDHWRLQLNNLLQRSFGVQSLRWECFQDGPQHMAPWTAVALINGVEFGRGQGHTQGSAKEQAAVAAYNGLCAELARRR